MAEDGESSAAGGINFPAEEEATLRYWAKIDAFQTSVKMSEGKKEYTFYDGPPFATGLPHYGHILAGTIKDTVTRYAHQTDQHVSRRFGWDCHGLPVEHEIDKANGMSAREFVEKQSEGGEDGIKVYNDQCRSIVQRYTAEWEQVVTRLGRWIDFENDYRTMDTSYMESVWWVFKTLFEKGLVYRGNKVMPYSTELSTALSNFEAGLNYRDVVDPAVVVSFPLVEDPSVSLVAWTTTPWTLPSNLAVCVNNAMVYVKVKSVETGKVYILAEARLVQLFPVIGTKKFKKGSEATVYSILAKFEGSTLVGKKYQPVFSCFDDAKRREKCFRVLSDDYVTSDAGTGIVHMAPAFGEDDYRVCAAHEIFDIRDETSLVCPVDASGLFTAEVGDSLREVVGLNVKQADTILLEKLKEGGRLVSKESYTHSYPFCWRSQKPLIYKAVSSWFVNVGQIKDRLLATNEETHWVPAQVKEKRFKNWLKDAKDWAVSRSRYWGTPMPLWVSDDGEEVVAIGSVQELVDLVNQGRVAAGQPRLDKLDDIHRQFVDKLEIPSRKTPGTMLKRVEDVFDCWFESGSMPYAQLHYPFECTPEKFKEKFPADFIAEGLDQTRGWFYTLMVLSTALFDKPAFQNLIVNGLVLATDGKKMSKSLKNYPDPTIVIDAHGSDALRLYLINSPVVKGETLKFQQEGVRGVLRDVMLPWFNAFRFFKQQASRWEEKTASSLFVRDVERARGSKNAMDKWIRASLEGLVAFVHGEMQAYRLYTVVPRLVGFLQDLTNWYVRLNRSRLKGMEGDDSARDSLAVLLEVLLKMAMLMAPFTPFFAEYLYQKLRPRLPDYAKRQALDAKKDAGAVSDAGAGAADSVHYLMLPKVAEPSAEQKKEDEAVVRGTLLLQKVLELGRRARESAKLSMKTPVKGLVVISTDLEALKALKEQALEPYLLSELNSWTAELSSDLDSWCILSALPNLPLLAKKLGKQMRPASDAIRALEPDAIRSYLLKGSLDVKLADSTVLTLVVNEIMVKTTFKGDDAYAAQSSDDGSLTVAIDVRQDDALRMQGIARDLCNRVNKLRKKAKLDIADVVEIYYNDDDDATGLLSTKAALAANGPLLQKAKMVPIPFSKFAGSRSCLAEDVAPTAFGSNALRLTLCAPAPALSSAAKSTFKGGDKNSLDSLVSALSQATLRPVLTGSLDGLKFAFTLGTDIFPDATTAYLKEAV